MKRFYLFLTCALMGITSLSAKPAAADANGKLPGAFKINDDCGMVYFSQGNLQYIGSAATPYWKFAEEQYNYIGDTGPTGQKSTLENVDRDLLGWGTAGYYEGATGEYQPYSTNGPSYQYVNYLTTGSVWDASKSDWGVKNAISNGGNQAGLWRALTYAEFVYILNTRTTGITIGEVENARFTMATVNTDSSTCAKGVILFPDGYDGPTSNSSGITWGTINGKSNYTTQCTKAGWKLLETKGCVLLPATGYRQGTSYIYGITGGVGDGACYWTSTGGGSSERATALFLTGSPIFEFRDMYRYQGYSVRLVKDMTPKEKKEASFPVASATNDPTAANLTYNTSTQYLLTAAASGVTGGTVKYRLGTSGDWKNSYIDASLKATNAGTYTVQWYVEANTGCYLSSEIKEIEVTIARASFTPNPMQTIEAASLTYNGSAQDLVTVSGSLETGCEIQYSTDGVNWSTTIPQGTDAGNYTIYYKVYKGTNYEYIPSPNTIAASIAKGNLPVGPLPASTSTIDYDETEKILLEIDPVAGATIWYKLGDGDWTTELPKATDAADYSVQYKIVPDDTDNYNTIGPNTVTVTIKDYPTVADNADPTSVLAELNNSGSPAPTNLKVKRTIYADGEYNTICLPFAVSASELTTSTHPLYGYERLKAFKGASVSGSGQDLSIDIFVEDVDHMDAGVPYLITYPAGNADIVNPVFTDITVTTTEPSAVSADGVTFQGMFAQVHIDPYTSSAREQDYLFLGTNSQLNWPLASETSSDVKMRGFRAYFIIDRTVITPAAAPSGTRARFVNAPKQPTSIENTELNTKVQKLLENGQLIILKNGIKYNAQGQVLK